MIKIPIQSASDVITNSSTEVYLCTTDSSNVRDMINAILKVANSNYTCDELFRIGQSENRYYITALDNSNSEEANKIDSLLDSLFYADGYYNG